MQTIVRRNIQVTVMTLFLALLGTVSSALAAGEILVWQFQHTLPGIQEAQASTVDSHGNLIITGYTNSGADDDLYTIKVSADGQSVLWAAQYANPLGDDLAVAVAVDGNDDVIITGYLFNGVNKDIVVIHYDGESGTQQWPPFLFNGAANGDDLAQALAVDALNNIYVAGYSQTGSSAADDALLFKLSPNGPNPDGTPIWQLSYNGASSGDDRFTAVATGADGIAVAGHSMVMHGGSRQDFDYLTMKIDYSGNILWQQTYDHGTENDLAYYVALDPGGNVVVSGEVLTTGRHDMQTIKYASADGQPLWTRSYLDGSPNIPRGMVIDDDGEVYLTGNSFTTNGKDDFYTARYAGTSGAVVWEALFDSGVNNSDIPQALAVDHTGGLYVTGFTHKATDGDDDFQTLKYNKENGNQIWQQAADGPPVGGNQQPVGVAVALSVTADGNVYVAGWSQQAMEDLDYYAVKYSADLLNSPTGLMATVVSQTRVDLAWQDNSNPPNNEDTFCVERCQGFGCADFTELTCGVPQDQTQYSDTTVSRDNWYSYRLSGQSAALGASLPTAPAAVLTTVIDYPAPEWLYLHDGEGLDDTANAIVVGRDNQPVATGMSASVNSQYDYYTVKLDRDNAAIPLWIDDYDGPDGQGDMGICLAVDANDDVVVSGFSSIDGGQGLNTNDIFTIKYAKGGPDPYTGYPLWTAQYNGPGNDDDRSTAVASAADGSDFTVVTGYGKNMAGNDDIYLIKYKPNYDTAGQEVWSITPFDGGYNDYPTATAFTPAGDVVVVGMTYNAAGDSDLFISQYRGSDGALMPGWPYVFDFGQGIDGINALAVAADGAIYVAGFAKNSAGNIDIYVNKFNQTGSPQWGAGKIIDGAGHGFDEAKGIIIDPNDATIAVGATVTSASGSQDFRLLRYLADGTLSWSRTLDLVDHDELLEGMAMSPSGEVCLVGETDDDVDFDILAVKYDHLGNLIGSTRFDHGFDDMATAITVNRLGEFYISGYSATGPLASDDYDFLVFRFNGQELQAPSPFTSVVHHTSVELQWTENDPTVSGYKLYRQLGACVAGGTSFTPANLILTAVKGTTSVSDGGLNIDTTYCYGIESYRNSPLDLSRIIERQVTTTVPVAPDNLVATINNTSAVDVCWHDNSASEDGFEVQRCTGLGCDFTDAASFVVPPEPDGTAPATCMVDTSACDAGNGKVFRYRVQSFMSNSWRSAFSQPGPSDTVTVSGLLAPATLAASQVVENRVELQWTETTVDETDFVVERCQGTGCSDFAAIGATSMGPYTDTTVLANISYGYRVKARKQNSCGEELSPPSNEITVTTVPPAPSALAATMPRAGVVSLTWTPQTTTHTGFLVERCGGTNCSNFSAVATISGALTAKFTDTSACFGMDGVNRYRVKALGPWGESATSAVAQPAMGTATLPTAIATFTTEASIKLSWSYANANYDGFAIQRCAGPVATCNQDAANFVPVAGSPASGQDDASLLALWHMDEPSWSGVPDEVSDSSGHGNHAQAKNGAAVDSPGKTGSGAALFDGVDYLSSTLVLDQSVTTPGFTFMAWVYPTLSNSTHQYIFSTDNGGADWGLSFRSSGWYLDTGNTANTYGSYATLNTWQQVAVVVNPVVGMQLFVNGTLRKTIVDLGYDTSTSPINIGRNPATGSYFTGLVDEVTVFNRPLSGQEVGQYYNNTRQITFLDSDGISLATTYNYRVTPLLDTLCGDWSASSGYGAVSATTPALPPAPALLTVSQHGTTELDLTWQDTTANEDGFVIERCQGTGCDFSTMESFQVGSGVTSYHDTSVCQGTTYRYRLKAVKGSAAPWEWQSAYSTAAEKTTVAAAAAALTLNVVSESEITVAWNDANGDEEGYELSRCLYEAGVTECDQDPQFTLMESFPGSIAGALLHYRMDEAVWNGTSNEVKDVGNAKHGRSYGGAVTVAGGRFGRAGSFNGTTAYVATTLTVDQKRNASGLTMEAWVYPTMTDASPRSVLSTENGGYDWGIVVMNGKWYVNTGLSQYYTGLTVDNTWQHITAVFTPQVGIRFYKNDQYVDINEIDHDLSNGVLNIGRQTNSTSASTYFQGVIDEVLVYGRPLTDAEVMTHNTHQELSAFTYQDTSVAQDSSYYYRVTARKQAGCGWSTVASAMATTPVLPPPTNLLITCTSTSCALGWQDNNGSETGYRVSRCDGTSGECGAPMLVDLAAGSTAFTDTTPCPSATYTYRVWATGPWGQTTPAEMVTTTATPPVISNLNANRVSEVEIDLTWSFLAADETAITLERCFGASCENVVLPAGTKSYADNELTANTEYCYRVNAAKTASCGWQSAWSGPVCATTNLHVGALNATPMDTTTIALAWADTFRTETLSQVERCTGDLAQCCANNAAACLGPFDTITEVTTNQHAYSDSTLCADSAYTYRVTTMDLGLSRANNGCWTKRAPFAFSTFPANTGVEVAIPYQSGMRADFADIRFYDTTAHRELPYRIKQQTNSVSATVWVKTGTHASISLYYGNPSATDSSDNSAVASAQAGVAAINFSATEGNGTTCLSFTHTWIAAPTLAVEAVTSPYSAPAAVNATMDEGVVVLTWTPGTGDESEFWLERDCGSGFARIATVPAATTTYRDTTFSWSQLCMYQVKGHKPGSCPWTTLPSASVQLLAPPEPPLVTATAENAFQIRLDWTDAMDEEVYDVEVKIFGGVWMPVATLGADQLSYTDMQGVNPNTQYLYRVRAQRGAVSSAWGQAAATTPAYTPGAATCPLP